MTLGAITWADLRMGGWAKGCLVMLIGTWLFFALLGIRNLRFPWRIVGGVAFIVASALWIGLHPNLAADWHLDAGSLGAIAQSGLADNIASSFVLNGVGALLLLCALLALLVAIDWLPLLPFAPLLATFARAEDKLRGSPPKTPAGEPAGAKPKLPDAFHRLGGATLFEREPRARPVAPTVAAPAPIEPPSAAVAVSAAPSPIAVVPPPPSSEDAAVAEAEPTDEPVTNWARFRPRPARETAEPSEEIPPDLPVDNALEATHNSTALADENRSVDTENEDASVLDQDQDEEMAPPLGGSTAIAEENAPAIPSTLEEQETLSPKRKKEPEPEEAPDPEKAPGEEEDDDEEGDDEEWEDDEEEEEEKEEEEEEEEEKEDEDWDEEEDEDWDEDEDEEEKDDEEKEDEEEKEEEDDEEDWDEEDDDEEEDDDKPQDQARPVPAAAACSTIESSLDAPPAVDAQPPLAASTPADPAETIERSDVDASGVFNDLPAEERALLARAVELVLGTESVSLSKLQRELAVTYYAAARVFERLEKEGFIAPYSGSLARAVRITREQWNEQMERRRRA